MKISNKHIEVNVNKNGEFEVLEATGKNRFKSIHEDDCEDEERHPSRKGFRHHRPFAQPEILQYL